MVYRRFSKSTAHLLSLSLCLGLAVLGVRAKAASADAVIHSKEEMAYIDPETCNAVYPNAAWIDLPLDPNAQGGQSERFRFFYFLPKPFDPAKKTILYAVGGPGGLSRAVEDKDILSDVYNVINYHIRGAGCSQVPASSDYDRLITTANTVEDLEALRSHLGVETWEVVFGSSYGTLLGARYAAQYPGALKRLVLEGLHDYYNERNHLITENQVPGFAEKLLESAQKSGLIALSTDEISRVKTDIQDGLEQLYPLAPHQSGIYDALVSGSYRDPKLKIEKPFLNHSLSYLMAVFRLNYMGWTPISPSIAKKLEFTQVILASEFYPEKFKPEALKDARLTFLRSAAGWGFMPEGKTPEELQVLEEFQTAATKPSAVVLPMLSNRVFSIIYKQDKAEYSEHQVHLMTPTFIINGSADGATPLAGALEFFDENLSGEKRFLTMIGTGHEMALPSQDCKNQLYHALASGSWDNRTISALFAKGSVCEVPDGMTLR